MGGRLPLVLLVIAAAATVVLEWRLLSWIGKRDRMFAPLPSTRLVELFKQSTSRNGLAQLLAADSYLRLRRMVYFAAIRSRQTGRYPVVDDEDDARLVSLANRLGLMKAEPAVATPPAEAPPTAAGSQPSPHPRQSL